MAHRFLVSYDLHEKTEKSYKAVKQAIESCGDAIEIQESVWIVFSSKKRDSVSDVVWNAMESDDKLVVTKILGVKHSGHDGSLSKFLEDHQNPD
jgi:hypothetical protein